MNQITKVLITGSSGYCGNFLAIYFAGKGIPVIGLDMTPHKAVKDVPNLKFIQMDVRNREMMKQIMSKEQPSHVIHLAYFMDPKHDKKLEYEVDFMGSKNALEVANETSSVKQFILMSSASAYGGFSDNPEFISEDQPLRPRDYNYGIYKKQVEEYYHKYNKRADLKLVIFRMCTAVGPSYYKKGGVVSSVYNAPFLINIRPGDGRVQFIHEDDVKVLFEKVMEDSEAEDTFNLAPDSYASTKELGEIYHKKSIPIPLWLLRGVFFLIWHLHLAALTPAIARLMAFGIIISPKKLMGRYNYKFQYTTKEAFMDAVNKRKLNGSL